MLGGLSIFTIGACGALLVTSFDGLLGAFALCAFGAAVGSVCTQTMIRDSYRGKALSHVFSVASSSIGISPVVGLLLGSWLAAQGGYLWVFAVMAILAFILGIWSFISLPETKPAHLKKDSLVSIAAKMCADTNIWYTVAMIALFNIALFSYYNIAPFMFENMGLGVDYFGYTGFVLAFGSIAGAFINRILHTKSLSGETIVNGATLLLVIGALSVAALQSTPWFYLPMAIVSLAFGLAIPHIMGNALMDYGEHLGSAGALLGALYYLLIGAGLHFFSHKGDLGETLLICSLLAMCLVCVRAVKARLGLSAATELRVK